MVNLARPLYILFFFGISAAVHSEVYTVFKNESIIYKADLPSGWQKTFRKTNGKYITSLTAGKSAGIVITVSGIGKDMKWQSLQEEYLKKAGLARRDIIESSDIPVGEGTASRLLLFEFPSRGKAILQRTLLMKNRDTLLTIECRAPTDVFGRYTEIFNQVMASVDFTQKTKEYRPENLEEDTKDEDSSEDTPEDRSAWDAAEKKYSLTGLSAEAKRAMKIELKKINELEKKGIIERIE